MSSCSNRNELLLILICCAAIFFYCAINLFFCAAVEHFLSRKFYFSAQLIYFSAQPIFKFRRRRKIPPLFFSFLDKIPFYFFSVQFRVGTLIGGNCLRYCSCSVVHRAEDRRFFAVFFCCLFFSVFCRGG